MTSRNHILTLLHHYRDVLEGIPDRDIPVRSDDLLALMCPAWNHPSYQQLERLLHVLWERFPRQHAALVTRYLRYAERRVAWCRKCGAHPPTHIGKVHVRCRYRGHAVTLRPKLVRVLPPDDRPLQVEEAVDWLCRHWRGIPVIPRSVRGIENERLLREAA